MVRIGFFWLYVGPAGRSGINDLLPSPVLCSWPLVVSVRISVDVWKQALGQTLGWITSCLPLHRVPPFQPMGALPPELLSSSPTLLAPCPVLTLPSQTAPSTSSSSPPSCRRTGSPAFPEGGSGRSHTTTAGGNKKRSHRCTPST